MMFITIISELYCIFVKGLDGYKIFVKKIKNLYLGFYSRRSLICFVGWNWK